MKANFLILSGDGINCERDCALAVNEAKGSSEIVHINDFHKLSKGQLEKFQGIIFPGGFSFGDELGSGQVLALKFENLYKEKLDYFLDKKLPIIGICNGFQFLVKLGLLPDPSLKNEVSLVENSHGKFLDRWIELKVNESPCIWTKGIDHISLPVRHGEGRLLVKSGFEEKMDQLISSGLAPLVYSEDINGSYKNIAGLTNQDGNILGLMPHPEAALFPMMNPDRRQWKKDQVLGLKLFENAIEYLK